MTPTIHPAARRAYAAYREAAAQSILCPIDPRNGHRINDPLRALIPGTHAATPMALYIVEQITGYRDHRDGRFTAPASRAALRRWALKNATTKENAA